MQNLVRFGTTSDSDCDYLQIDRLETAFAPRDVTGMSASKNFSPPIGLTAMAGLTLSFNT